MSKKTTIRVQETDISVLLGSEQDYFSLTDIAKRVNPEQPADLIANWMKNRDTIELLEIWEKLHNPDFNLLHLEEVKKEVGLNRFIISPTKWIETTNAIGMVTKSGRYGGGTFAHKDIAMAFCFWISPAFQLLVITEFQRLKALEAEEKRETLDWNLNAHFIKDGLAKDERLVKLNEIAIYQLQLLAEPKALQEVKQLSDGAGNKP